MGTATTVGWAGGVMDAALKVAVTPQSAVMGAVVYTLPFSVPLPQVLVTPSIS